MDPLIERFVGFRHPHGVVVLLFDAAGDPRELPRHLEVFSHSPNGFEWGYAGSGPAQLALAMCVELVGPERAERVHQTVKDRLVVRLDREGWTLSGRVVLRAILAAERHAGLA